MSTLLKQVISSGFARLDLLGGTLDLGPLAHQLAPQCTINAALSLAAKVTVIEQDLPGLRLESKDYGLSRQFTPEQLNPAAFYEKSVYQPGFFGPLALIAALCIESKFDHRLFIQLQSAIPAGSGLGGSSVMSIALLRAIRYWQRGQDLLAAGAETNDDRLQLMMKAKSIEERSLAKGLAGYQDYFPALYGGLLALHPQYSNPHHPVAVEQLYSEECAAYLSQHLLLIDSGVSHFSAVNNWEILKAFFDGDHSIRSALSQLAELSQQGLQCLRRGQWQEFLSIVAADGLLRAELFPGFVTPEMYFLSEHLRLHYPGRYRGLKVCGAGGGGCFLVIGLTQEEVAPLLAPPMAFLPLQLMPPLPMTGQP